nr:immunoglobulin heavy chain junction region [Mus musculus]
TVLHPPMITTGLLT